MKKLSREEKEIIDYLDRLYNNVKGGEGGMYYAFTDENGTEDVKVRDALPVIGDIRRSILDILHVAGKA